MGGEFGKDLGRTLVFKLRDVPEITFKREFNGERLVQEGPDEYDHAFLESGTVEIVYPLDKIKKIDTNKEVTLILRDPGELIRDVCLSLNGCVD